MGVVPVPSLVLLVALVALVDAIANVARHARSDARARPVPVFESMSPPAPGVAYDVRLGASLLEEFAPDDARVALDGARRCATVGTMKRMRMRDV